MVKGQFSSLNYKSLVKQTLKVLSNYDPFFLMYRISIKLHNKAKTSSIISLHFDCCRSKNTSFMSIVIFATAWIVAKAHEFSRGIWVLGLKELTISHTGTTIARNCTTQHNYYCTTQTRVDGSETRPLKYLFVWKIRGRLDPSRCMVITINT